MVLDDKEIKAENICRTCMCDSNYFISLYDDINCLDSFIKLAQILMECTSIYAFPNDGLPSNICSKCLKQLESSYKFRMKCIKVDDALKSGDYHFDSENIFEIYKNHDSESNQSDSSLDSVALQTRLKRKKKKIRKKQKFELNEVEGGNLKDVNTNSLIQIENINFQNNGGDDVDEKNHQNSNDLKEIDDFFNDYYDDDEKRDGDSIQIDNKQQMINRIDKENRLSNSNSDAEDDDNESFDPNEPIYKDRREIFVDGKPVKKRRRYRHRQKDIDEKPNLITCEACNKTYKHMNGYKAHMNLHLGVFAYQCDICPEKFTASRYLREHKKRHSLRGLKIIPKGAPPKQEQGMKIFETSDNEAAATTSPPNIKFNASNNVYYRRKNKDKNLRCNVCSKKFANSNSYKYHMNMHMGIYEYQCDMCPKKFTALLHLTNHKKRHGMPKTEPKFLCNLCGKKYSTKQGLRIHLTGVHTQQRPFKCNQCGMGFSAPSGLRSHQKRNNSCVLKKRWQCDQCSKSYTIAWNLSLHKRKHENGTWEDYSCPTCGKNNETERSLQMHMRIHLDDGRKLHCCPICDKVLSRSSTLKDHLRTHSSIRPFSCDVCNQTFRNRKSLHMHPKRCTGTYSKKNFQIVEKESESEGTNEVKPIENGLFSTMEVYTS